ncbi:MAG: DUF2851 family protein [Candidatus Sumerlaeaceae bacterium]
MSSLSRYEELKALLRGESFCIAENAESLPQELPPFDERLVQAIWHEQLVHADKLQTVSGKTIRVLDPGQWNGERGPDFKSADLEIAGQRLRGDIEIHVHASDWERHNHQRDFEYNRVILHVVLHCDNGAPTDLLHNAQQVDRLELAPVLNPDLDTIRRSLAGEDFMFADRSDNAATSCHHSVARVNEELLREFFLEAAHQRLESKVARFQAQRSGESLDQVLYQAIMTAMGYKGGKTLFFLLAKRTPIEELKDYHRDTPLPELPIALEALLLHVANLAAPSAKTLGAPGDMLEDSCESPLLDADTLVYVDRLHGYWHLLSGYFQDRIIPPTRRWFGSVRPVNFPTRRIAGVARLLTNFDFRRGFVASFARAVRDAAARQPKSSRDFKREIMQLGLLFSAEGESYWSTHYTLGGRRAKKPMQLIGEERALSVLYNALLPICILYAREERDPALEKFLWRLHEHFPALPENAITRFMRHRLFGETGPPAGLNFRFEKHNQALFQVFHECCNNAALTCEDCIFARRAAE